MSRFVHEEGLRERQNMREAARNRKRGNWCIVGFKDEWENGFGLQGRGYESKSEAKKIAKDIESEEEYKNVEHKVMTHQEYNKKYAPKDKHGTIPIYEN